MHCIGLRFGGNASGRKFRRYGKRQEDGMANHIRSRTRTRAWKRHGRQRGDRRRWRRHEQLQMALSAGHGRTERSLRNVGMGFVRHQGRQPHDRHPEHEHDGIDTEFVREMDRTEDRGVYVRRPEAVPRDVPSGRIPDNGKSAVRQCARISAQTYSRRKGRPRSGTRRTDLRNEIHIQHAVEQRFPRPCASSFRAEADAVQLPAFRRRLGILHNLPARSFRTQMAFGHGDNLGVECKGRRGRRRQSRREELAEDRRIEGNIGGGDETGDSGGSARLK